VPIARTFCPPVAGAANMRYSRYLAYDIVGGCCWAGGLILVGYFLGRSVPNIGDRIHWVIMAVVAVSFLPLVIGAVRSRSGRKGKHTPLPAGQSSEE